MCSCVCLVFGWVIAGYYIGVVEARQLGAVEAIQRNQGRVAKYVGRRTLRRTLESFHSQLGLHVAVHTKGTSVRIMCPNR